MEEDVVDENGSPPVAIGGDNDPMDDIVADPDSKIDTPAEVSGGNAGVTSDLAVGAGGPEDAISVDYFILVAEDVWKETAAAGDSANGGNCVGFVSITGDDVNDPQKVR